MGIVKRSEKKAFYKVNGEEVYSRMTGFTEISKSMNASEYTRKYVDCDFEESDVVGYAPSLSVAFDEHTKNNVHSDLKAIFDEEKTGEDAVREIVIVDFTNPVGDADDRFCARMRKYSVIPSSEGNGTEHYEYNATLRAKSDIVVGVATSDDNWKTITFIEEE